METIMGRKLRVAAAVAAVAMAGATVTYWAVAQRNSKPPDLRGFARHSVASADGATISYLSIGTGPGVIVLPGALTVAADYADLARGLAGHFTVHVVDRRGHGASDPQGAQYSVEKELADVAAVRTGTGAHFLFGHSFGGFVGLEAARRQPEFTRVALYEPGVSIDGSMATGWMKQAERHLADGDDLDALTDFVRGTSPDAAGTPHWMLKPILPMVIKRNVRQQMYELLPAAVQEHRELARLDNTYREYAQIAAPVLLIRGSESDASSDQAAAQLAGIIPHATRTTLKGLDHFGPDQTGPARVAQAITDFFGTAPS
jgi:pimeloyl-ACP methyl ester carboxylesterase